MRRGTAYSQSVEEAMTNFADLFKMGQQMKAGFGQLQSELETRTVTATSGGGMVSVVADGRGQIKSLKIDPSVVNKEDIEMLEDLIVAAVSDAQQRAEALAQEEMKKLYGGFNLPFNLPGM
jgi:DNA-binding YbaB/EbfC family protein